MLDPRWPQQLDLLAPRLLGDKDRTGAALVQQIARLSQTYTRQRDDLRQQEQALAARLRFFLPRDLDKISGALSELASVQALPQRRTWRVLDLGAGLGTTTLGVAAFAKQTGCADAIDVVTVEWDDASSAVAQGLFTASTHTLRDLVVPIEARAKVADLTALTADDLPGPFDLIVLGLSLNELFPNNSASQRARLLQQLRERLCFDGSLIVIEPALRAVTRTLQQVRDLLVARDIVVFSPCTHSNSCPLLERERDWCHEDIATTLPPALADLAKRAGLRWERLTYSQLVLHAGNRRLASDRLRVVGGPVFSKGRTEWHGCSQVGVIRVARLDRYKSKPDPLDTARRGTLLHIEPSPQAGDTVRTDRFVVRVDSAVGLGALVGVNPKGGEHR